MQFKIGDKVRLTREAIAEWAENAYYLYKTFVFGATISHVNGDRIMVNNDYENPHLLQAHHFELVPEEPEFKQGELIEVRDHEDGNWYILPFIYKIPGKAMNRYITVTALDVHAYNNNQEYSVEGWRYARKIKPQLTRKEIAEKFGVSEDFTLID